METEMEAIMDYLHDSSNGSAYNRLKTYVKHVGCELILSYYATYADIFIMNSEGSTLYKTSLTYDTGVVEDRQYLANCLAQEIIEYITPLGNKYKITNRNIKHAMVDTPKTIAERRIVKVRKTK